MTWREFKEKIEAAGIKDTTEISHFDWNGDTDPEVYVYPNGHFRVYDGIIDLNDL